MISSSFHRSRGPQVRSSLNTQLSDSGAWFNNRRWLLAEIFNCLTWWKSTSPIKSLGYTRVLSMHLFTEQECQWGGGHSYNPHVCSGSQSFLLAHWPIIQFASFPTELSCCRLHGRLLKLRRRRTSADSLADALCANADLLRIIISGA